MAESAAIGASYALPRDTLQVEGPERKTWLDGLLTCAVTPIAPGLAGYGLLLTKQGKIVSDVFLADSGERLFVGVGPGLRGEIQQLLDRYLVMEDAELSIPARPLAWELLQGQNSWQDRAGALAGGTLKLGELELGLRVASAPGPESAATVDFSHLLARHGLGTFGVDFGQGDNPHEASLDRVAVSWTKGCYLGQEVVCMQDMRGKVKRRLVALDGGPGVVQLSIPRGGQGPDVLSADGRVAGHVTSVHAGPGSGTRLLASLSTAALESEGTLTVSGQPVRVVSGSPAKVG